MVRRLVASVILTLVGTAWLAGTATRVEAYRSDITIWADAVAQAPTKPRGLVNLGQAYQIARVPDHYAMTAYAAAIRASTDPRRSPYSRAFTWAAATCNLAFMKVTHDDLDGADADIDRVLAKHPNFPMAHKMKAFIAQVRKCGRPVCSV